MSRSVNKEEGVSSTVTDEFVLFATVVVVPLLNVPLKLGAAVLPPTIDGWGVTRTIVGYSDGYPLLPDALGLEGAVLLPETPDSVGASDGRGCDDVFGAIVGYSAGCSLPLDAVKLVIGVGLPETPNSVGTSVVVVGTAVGCSIG